MFKKCLLLGILVAFVTPSFVVAAPTSPKRTTSSYSSNLSLREELNLTPEQRKQASELRKISQAKIKPYREELAIIREASLSVERGSAKDKKLKAKREEIQQKIEAIQIENERQFVTILTPEQKAKYSRLKADRKRRIERYTRG
jgi:Spy/CpxP family protein refolding chaperone